MWNLTTSRRPLLIALLSALSLSTSLPAFAADLAPSVIPAVPVDGAACSDPAVAAFPSVWLGHFSGGYSHALGPGLPVALDWRDETICFSSRSLCQRHMRVMRRDFHRPEGYFTCLPIR